MTSLWMVIICDKELEGEPDVGLGFAEGEEQAKGLGRELCDQLAGAGRGRCVWRVKNVEVGRGYRATAILRTPAPDRYTSGTTSS